MKFSVIIVYKLSAARYPLPIAFSPAAFGPARVGHRNMQSSVQHLVPVNRGKNMTKRIVVVVQHHLGHAGSTRGEEHKHRVSSACALIRDKFLAATLQQLVKIQPSGQLFP